MTLYEAVLAGDVTAVKRALATEKDVNVLGPEKRTPLIEAAAAGRLELVKLLLKAGAEAEWKDEAMETALLKAAANGHAAVAAELLPRATDDERDLARSFLKAFAASSGKDYVYDPHEAAKKLGSRVETEPPPAPSAAQHKAADVAARAANFFGYQKPLERLERADRANEKKKK